jgi:hypothetical protein
VMYGGVVFVVPSFENGSLPVTYFDAFQGSDNMFAAWSGRVYTHNTPILVRMCP